MPKLSVLIPSRNEPYLKQTIDDVLRNMRGDTEVIAVCDGAWPVEGIPDDPRVHLVYVPTAIGQRAATNLAAKLSTADYVMKLDAHCSLSEGFDVALMQGAEVLGPDVTQICRQQHLHVHTQECRSCGYVEHHGPKVCRQCGSTETIRHHIWEPRRSRPRRHDEAGRGSYVESTAWHFDSQPKFGYFGELQNRPEGQQRPFSETMSFLGAFFFVSRARYWQLGGFDEAYGVWGLYGLEWAAKSWLSGGRVVVNHNTACAHLFRSQGTGEFSFCYPLTASQQHAALRYARDMWFNNKWPGQVRPLSWLIDRFWPIPGWLDADRAAVTEAGAAFTRSSRFTDSTVAMLTARGATIFGQQVSEEAVSLSGLSSGGSISPQHVLGMSDQSQMYGVDAGGAVAREMIEDSVSVSERYGLNQPCIKHAVDILGVIADPTAAEQFLRPHQAIPFPITTSDPPPTSRLGVNANLAKDPADGRAIEVGDCKIGSSHDVSSSIASRLGPAEC